MQCKGSQEGGTLKTIYAQGYENTISTATLEQGRGEHREMRAGTGSAGTRGLYPANGSARWGVLGKAGAASHDSHCVACCPC